MRTKLTAALLGVVAVIALTAQACTGETSRLYPVYNDGNPATVDRPPHWLNTTFNGEAVVYFVIDPSVPVGFVRTSDNVNVDVRALIRKSARDWSQAANFQFRDATPNEGQYTCTSASNCVLISAVDRDGGSVGWYTEVVHVARGPYGMQMRISNRWSQMTYAFIAGMLCHEEGHIAGPLRHSLTNPGPCAGGLPTAWDIALVESNNRYHAH